MPDRLIAGAGADDEIKADTNNATAQVGYNDTISTAGDFDLETVDSGTLYVAPEVHTYGLAAAASVNALARIQADDEANVGNNTTVVAQGNLNVDAGQTADGMTNSFSVTSFGDELNGSAIPIDELNSNGVVNQIANVNVGANSKLESAQNINLISQLNGSSVITAYGEGKTWLSAISSAINSATGASIPATMQGGTSTRTTRAPSP